MTVTKEALAEAFRQEWVDGQYGSCNCHTAPPCGYCVGGFSLSCEEYVELNLAIAKSLDQLPTDTPADDYDRAMKGLF